MLETTEEDKEALQDLITNNGFEMPAVKISIYKNRRGQYKNILLWCRERRGTCRIEPMFATGYDYKLIDIPDLVINVGDYGNSLEQESAF